MLKIKEIEWSEPSPPNEDCRYDHVAGRCALGEYSIEWKSWKKYDPPCIYFNGEWLATKHIVEDAKELAQNHFEELVKQCLDLNELTPDSNAPTDEEILEIAGKPDTTPCWPWWLKEGVEVGEVRDAAVRFARSVLHKFGSRPSGEIYKKVIELCDAVENIDNIPPENHGVRCLELTSEIKSLIPTDSLK